MARSRFSQANPHCHHRCTKQPVSVPTTRSVSLATEPSGLCALLGKRTGDDMSDQIRYIWVCTLYEYTCVCIYIYDYICIRCNTMIYIYTLYTYIVNLSNIYIYMCVLYMIYIHMYLHMAYICTSRYVAICRSVGCNHKSYVFPRELAGFQAVATAWMMGYLQISHFRGIFHCKSSSILRVPTFFFRIIDMWTFFGDFSVDAITWPSPTWAEDESGTWSQGNFGILQDMYSAATG